MLLNLRIVYAYTPTLAPPHRLSVESVESVEAASPQFQSSENDSFVLVSTCSLHIAALDFFSFFYQQTSMSYLDFNFIFLKAF